jgi:universal stress protein A
MHVRPRRILWPTDFSELSDHAARYARGMAESYDSELHVVHVVCPPLTPDMAMALPADIPAPYIDENLLQVSQERLQKTVDTHLAGLAKVKTDAFFGNPWSAICTYARDHDINLIVVTTHGRTGLRHVLIGSTAERIVQHAPCPVLVVKHPETDFVEE